MKTIHAIILLAITLGSCNNSNPPKLKSPEKVVIPKLGADYAAIETDEYWFSYPKAWTHEEAENADFEFTVAAPVEEEDLIGCNLNLGIEVLPGSNITTKQYTNSLKTQVGNMIDNFKVTQEADVPNKYAACRKIEYTGTMDGIDIKWKQYVYIKNSKAYILTFACMDLSTTNNISDAISDKMLNSFIVK